MTTSTQATTNNTPATDTKVNPFLAVFAKEEAKIEAEFNKSFTASVEKSKQLTDAACQSMNITLSDAASDIYGLLLSANASDSIAAASGKQLADAVDVMITAYFKGNKEALQPVVDASNVWVKTKCKGEVKTANIPNNLRLLVSRHSQSMAEGDEENEGLANYKLTISVEGKKNEKAILIKEGPLKAPAKKTAAQKVFESITKMDSLDRDELLALVATDAAMLAQFATLSALEAVKKDAVTKDHVADLENRRNAAAKLEDDLNEELEEKSEAKLALTDKVLDMKDKLAEVETKLTEQRVTLEGLEKGKSRLRKAEKIAEREEEISIATAIMQELLAESEELEGNIRKEAAQLIKAEKALDAADEAYNNQAYLVSTLGKQVQEARAQIH